MNDQYERQLVRELEVHAEDPTVAPGLAGRLIDRAHVVRRRRQAVVASVTAVGAVVGILFAVNGFGVSGRDNGRPVGRTPTTAPTASSDAVAPTQLARVTRGKFDPASALRPMPFFATNRVSMSGGLFQMPRDWAVMSITSAGDGLVLHVTVLTPTGIASGVDFLAYLSPDGLLRRLPHAHLPFFVNPAGTMLVAGSLLTAPGQDSGTPLDSNGQLVAYQLPSVTAVPVAGLPADLQVQGFAGNDTMLVGSVDGAPQLWNPSTGARTPLATGTTLLAVNVHGDRLINTGDGVIDLTADGAERWRSRPFGDVIGFSPPGDLLAAFSPAGRPSGITLRDFGSGAELLHFTLLPVNRPSVHEGVWGGWADDRTLIVQTGGTQGADARYARCTIGTPTCQDLGVIQAQLELPGQAFFD